MVPSEARHLATKLGIARSRLAIARTRSTADQREGTTAVLTADRLAEEVADLERQLDLEPGEWPNTDAVAHSRLPYRD